MQTVFLAVLIIGGSVLLALAGLGVVRRRFSASDLESNHEVGGLFINVLGVIYAQTQSYHMSHIPSLWLAGTD
jgi:multisubunit Na+/H+ antiporter MnhG subunit